MADDWKATLTLAGIVRHHGAVRPDHDAVRGDAGVMTYGELDEASNRVARALLDASVGAGDRVAFVDKNSPEQFELLFGAAKLGAVAVPVSYRLATAEVEAVLADARPAVWVVGPDHGHLAAVAPGDTTVLGIGGHDALAPYEVWRDAQPADDPGVVADADEVALLLYSSGTTGRPKGIQLSHANLASSFTVWDELVGLGPDSVFLVALPLFHVGGLGWALAGLIEGATAVVVADIVPGPLAELIERDGLTHLGLVPAVIQFMLQTPGIDERDFSRVQACLYGAAPINEEVLTRAMEVIGCTFVQAYGLTETTATVVVLRAEDHDPGGPHAHRLRAAGRPFGPHRVRIVDPASGEEVRTGEVGEIVVRSPNVMVGYWEQPELTAQAVVDGWFHTGDAGYVDDDGFVYLHDRVKDMIVSGGENIYSIEIERALASHPDVADVAVIAVPSKRWGETPKAVVVRRPGTDVTGTDLIDHCRSRLATFKCPSAVDFVDELPRNATGKVLKKELRAPHWEGRDRQVG